MFLSQLTVMTIIIGKNRETKAWSYADVLPYFKKAENRERGATSYRGIGGPLNVMNMPSINPLTSAFIEAGVELGWPRNDDHNGSSQEGFGVVQYTIRQGKRGDPLMLTCIPHRAAPI